MKQERDLQAVVRTQFLIKMSRFPPWKQVLLLLIVRYPFTTVSSYLEFLTGDDEAPVPTVAPFEAGSNGK